MNSAFGSYMFCTFYLLQAWFFHKFINIQKHFSFSTRLYIGKRAYNNI